ncbi:MAG: GMC family oxidoreductase [Gammaproteobacteria bacterium]|nr:GMC family oxidoreductase [Gammaproteobacteria bacterium]
MIIDASEIKAGTSIPCDLCIIGAGAAGITIAREFDGIGLNVWLLESGGYELEQPTQDLYKGTSTGRRYFPLDKTRLRYLGGTTNHWAGLCRPMDAIDFESRAWIPNSGWPFNRDHLVPWYMRAQPILDLGEYIYNAEHWIDENQRLLPFKTGTFRTEVYQASTPLRFGTAYREQLRKSRNITVCLHANLTHLQVDKPSAQLKSLRIQTLDGNQFSISPQTCTLACGSIENARLLLSSKDIHPDGLGNESGNVGRYFMDHPVLSRNGSLMTTSGRIPEIYYDPYYFRQRRPLYFTVLLDEVSQRQQQVANYSALFFPALLSKGVKSYRRISRKLSRDQVITGWWQHISNILGDLDSVSSKFYYDHLTNKPAPLQLDFYNQWEQVPDPDNRVTLDRARDSLGIQRVNIRWQLGEIDRRTILTAHRMMALEVGRTDLGRVRLGISENDPLPDTVRGDNHQMGTTRMHENPALGVVDANCCLHTVHNLYMAGASVFPTGGSTNPTLTVVALALRLADHIKEKLA